jgi:hypothetical protein
LIIRDLSVALRRCRDNKEVAATAGVVGITPQAESPEGTVDRGAAANLGCVIGAAKAMGTNIPILANAL